MTIFTLQARAPTDGVSVIRSCSTLNRLGSQVAQQSIPYSADVFHHKPRSPLTLALLKRREYLGMLPHRGLTGKLEGAVTQEDGLVMHVVQDFSQTSIFTPLGQQAMEGAIGPNVIRFITLLQVLPSGIVHVAPPSVDST